MAKLLGSITRCHPKNIRIHKRKSFRLISSGPETVPDSCQGLLNILATDKTGWQRERRAEVLQGFLKIVKSKESEKNHDKTEQQYSIDLAAARIDCNDEKKKFFVQHAGQILVLAPSRKSDYSSWKEIIFLHRARRMNQEQEAKRPEEEMEEQREREPTVEKFEEPESKKPSSPTREILCGSNSVEENLQLLELRSGKQKPTENVVARHSFNIGNCTSSTDRSYCCEHLDMASLCLCGALYNDAMDALNRAARCASDAQEDRQKAAVLHQQSLEVLNTLKEKLSLHVPLPEESPDLKKSTAEKESASSSED